MPFLGGRVEGARECSFVSVFRRRVLRARPARAEGGRGCCTCGPRRPGAAISAPAFPAAAAGPGGSTRPGGGRVHGARGCAPRDSAPPAAGPAPPPFLLDTFPEGVRVRAGNALDPSWACPSRAFLQPQGGRRREGGGLCSGRCKGSSPSRPSPRAEIVLEASGAQRPALVPESRSAGSLRGGFPPRVAPADACPAVTRVGPSGYGHHLSCVRFGPMC